MRATSGPTYWSEGSACNQQSNLGTFFLEYNHTELEYNHTEPEFNHTEAEYNHTEPVPLFKTPQGVVIGSQKFV